MFCQNCGIEAATRNVSFRQNIGLLIRRRYKKIDGNLCRTCINKYFWEYTGTTLVLGWWGTISFFATVFILITNPLNYLKSLGMPPVPPNALRPRLTEEAAVKLSTHTKDIAARIQNGQPLERIADEVASHAGVTPGQVVQFVRAAAGIPVPNYDDPPKPGFKLWWLLVVIGLGALFCLVAYLGISTLIPIGEVSGCSSDTMADYLQSHSLLLTEYEDTITLAASDPNASLSSTLERVQAIRRQSLAMDVPDCARDLHFAMIEYMDSGIGFLESVSLGDEVQANTYLEQMEAASDRYNRELEILRSQFE